MPGDDETVTLKLPSGEEVDAIVPSGMSDDQVHDLMKQKHPEYFQEQTPAPPKQIATPSVSSRFWGGVKHGMGDNSDTPPNHGTWRHPDFADNPLLPGSGVYRDIKAGNYAGAMGRVAGPAVAIGTALMGGRERAIPTEEPAQVLANTVAADRARAIQPGFPNRAEGLPEIEAMRPEATAKFRSIVESDRQPIDTSRGKIGQLLNKATDAQPLTKGIPLKDQGSSVIQSFKYDPTAREMTVSTKNGGQYIHGDVTPEQAQAFQQADSKGKAWNDLRNNSTLVAKMVNGKRVSVRPPKAIQTATPDDLTPLLKQSLERVKPKQ